MLIDVKNFKLSITRNPKWFGYCVFFGVTSLWAICEPIISALGNPSKKYWFLGIFLLISLIIAFIKAWPKNMVEFKLPNTNSTVGIRFGDLFSSNGVIGIGVNEYFDSEIGKPVSTNSLHGFFLENILGKKFSIFDDAVKKELKGKHIQKVERDQGKKKKYEIGSTVPIDFGEKKYLLFALSKTNEEYEAHTSPSLIMKALNGLFNKARSECNGQNLYLPLIGTGLSRSGIPAKNIIGLILTSILKSTKEAKITNRIEIVIDLRYYDEIDLNSVKRIWE